MSQLRVTLVPENDNVKIIVTPVENGLGARLSWAWHYLTAKNPGLWVIQTKAQLREVSKK